MYVLGCETLGFESNAPVLSAGLLYFDLDKSYNFMDLVNDVKFVKFKLKEQIEVYNRIIDKKVLDYWKSNDEEAKVASFIPSKNDVSFIEGVEYLRKFADPNDSDIVLSRGFLSKNCMDSLCRAVDIPVLFKHWQYSETATMINCLKNTAKNGYCPVSLDSICKFNLLPHRIANEAYMILYGE